MKNLNKWKQTSGWFMAFLMAVLLLGMTVSAMELPEGMEEVDGEVVNTFAYLTETADAYERPDTGSAVVATLEKEKQVLLMLKMNNDWCQIIDAGQTMYIQAQYIEVVVNEELSKEMEELEAVRESEATKDVVVRKQLRQNRIMGIVIAVLIAAIFIAGIVAVIRSDSGEESQEEQEAESNKLGLESSTKTKTIKMTQNAAKEETDPSKDLTIENLEEDETK